MSTTSINLDKNLIEYMLKYGTSENSFQINLRNETSLHKYSMMQISPEQGQFMGLLAKIMGARNYLEIGTYEGNSAMFVARTYKDSNVYCVDNWKKTEEYGDQNFSLVEKNFDTNVSNFSNIIKIVNNLMKIFGFNINTSGAISAKNF